MSTKVKNKLYLTFIILSAFFTFIAYLADQIVLRKENLDRVMRSNYQNLELEISKISNYSQIISSLSASSNEIFLYGLKKNNFILKNLILTSSEFLDDEIKKKNIEILTDNSKFFNNKSKSQQIYSLNRFINIIADIHSEYSRIFTLERENPLISSIKNFKFKLDDRLQDIGNLFEENKDKFYYYKSFDAIYKTLLVEDSYTTAQEYDKSSLDKAFDIRNFKLLLLEVLLKETKYLNYLSDELDDIVENKTSDRDTLHEKIKENKYIINLFILIGISSQILTLLFLLLFFKSLLKQGMRI